MSVVSAPAALPASGIEITGVGHSIGPARILQDISLTLPTGKVTALIGPNGAGKSTLLRLMARIDPLREGQITISGLDLASTPTARLALEMAFLGQHMTAASRLRLHELVSFGRWPHCKGRPGAGDRQAVSRAIADFDLTGLSGRFMDELSGGQAQRAHLAMTFAQETPWVLLDEPLNNLDIAHARGLMAHLAAARDRGRSVVVVLHDLNHAAAWADHIVAMKNGRVVASGPPREVITAPALSDLYETEVDVTEHQGRPLVLHHL